jgi:Pyridine nucleotide-disulphide oxidoreductase
VGASTDVVIVGSGPYGLSIATHLRAAGVDYRICGKPMHSWLEHMPRGMLLKSEGFASNLYNPDQSFTLRQFCESQSILYADIGFPVPLETFAAYGLEFQKRFVPELERRSLTGLSRSPSGFVLEFDNGDSFAARRVVLALGLTFFRHVPTELADLPASLLSHSGDHSDLSVFKGRDVTVIGGGASAIDLTALLHEAGADVRLVARRRTLVLVPKIPLPRSVWQRMRRPMSEMGVGWRTFLYSEEPLLFRLLPERIRLLAVSRELGPAGGWQMRDRLLGRIPVLLDHHLQRAWSSNGRAYLQFSAPGNAEYELTTEHVIAATGYRTDLRRLSFLSDDIQLKLKSVQKTPILSSHFESSVPGLYFVGPTAANSFGPLMRFAAGAKFAARRISAHLAK